MQRQFLCSAASDGLLTCTEIQQEAAEDRFLAAACAPPAEGLVGWWRADGNALDSSGYRNNGQYCGWYAVGYIQRGGSQDKAFSIRGRNSIVTIPSNPILEPQQVTVSAWIRGSQPDDYRWIVAKGASNCDSPSYGLYSTASPNEVRFIVYDGNTFGVASAIVPGIWDEQYHLLTGTYDGSQVEIYVDGLLSGVTAYSGVIKYDLSPSRDLNIGGYVGCPPGPNNFSFAGDIDDVQIYDRALTANEIAAIYSASTDGTC
jgi:hypothetical protein